MLHKENIYYLHPHSYTILKPKLPPPRALRNLLQVLPPQRKQRPRAAFLFLQRCSRPSTEWITSCLPALKGMTLLSEYSLVSLRVQELLGSFLIPSCQKDDNSFRRNCLSSLQQRRNSKICPFISRLSTTNRMLPLCSLPSLPLYRFRRQA